MKQSRKGISGNFTSYKCFPIELGPWSLRQSMPFLRLVMTNRCASTFFSQTRIRSSISLFERFVDLSINSDCFSEVVSQKTILRWTYPPAISLNFNSDQNQNFCSESFRNSENLLISSPACAPHRRQVLLLSLEIILHLVPREALERPPVQRHLIQLIWGGI